jgi:hypothetical protein
MGADPGEIDTVGTVTVKVALVPPLPLKTPNLCVTYTVWTPAVSDGSVSVQDTTPLGDIGQKKSMNVKGESITTRASLRLVAYPEPTIAICVPDVATLGEIVIVGTVIVKAALGLSCDTSPVATIE